MNNTADIENLKKIKKQFKAYPYTSAIDNGIKALEFTNRIIKIIDSTDFPEYKEDEALNLIKEFYGL